MTARTLDRPGLPAAPAVDLAAAVAPTVALTVAWIRDAAERARSRRDLAAMDDRGLADVGISREAARAEAAKPFWRA